MRGNRQAARRDAAAEGEPEVDLGGLRLLWPYLTEFPARVFLAMLCLVIAKLAGVALPLMLKTLVDRLDLSKQTVLVLPLALLLAYGAVRFATVIFGELRDLVFGRVAERAMRRSSLRVFDHLHSLDLDFHLSRRTGGLSRDIERGVNGISFLLRFMLFNILPTLLELALVAGILLVRYGSIYAVITAVSVLLYVAFSVITTEWRTRYVREANRLDSRANTRAIDSLLNYETVKLFGTEKRESAEYDDFLAKWEVAQRQNRLSLAALNSGQALIVGGSLTWMLILAAGAVTEHRMSMGDFVAINAYMIQLFVPLNFLGFVYREIRRAATDISKMFSLLNQEPRVADAADAKALAPGPARISFERVAFGYGAQRRILHDVSFEVPPGKKIALVGPSGSGKSTIARLLFRFYDPDAGRICIDGQDLRTVTQASLRAAIGVVPQDTVLFNDTIFYNIAYGKPDATVADVDRVARLAHLEAFIAHLPDGYQTMVGERGLKVSGGEKQRIAIARALLKNPAIMIFDEATSSLDSASEQAILAAIREVAKARTSLVIAHRLSTITDADEIVLLEQGRVSERGTHAALLAQDGAYARLWRLQQRQEHPPGAA